MATRSTSFIFSREETLDQPIPLQPITPMLILSANMHPAVALRMPVWAKIEPATAAPVPLMKFLRFISILCILLLTQERQKFLNPEPSHENIHPRHHCPHCRCLWRTPPEGPDYVTADDHLSC